MDIPKKQLKNGFSISEIWFWTWLMWGRTTRDMNNDDQRDIEAIQYAISRWMTCFDSAEMYAGWYSETLLWKAIEWYKREDLFISSKVRWDNCSYNATKKACLNSLKRLDTEYIDLYYIHWRDEQFDLKETMKALCELVDEWYIKYIWVSNFSVKSLQQAQKYSRYPIVANQVHFNLRCRESVVSGLSEFCEKNDIMLVAWRPFEYWNFVTSENRELFDGLCEKYNKTPFQISLNWIISHQNTVTLFKSSTYRNIDENLWALWWELEQVDIELLRKDFSWQIDISDAVPLA